jgi:hypothetical protein
MIAKNVLKQNELLFAYFTVCCINSCHEKTWYFEEIEKEAWW